MGLRYIYYTVIRNKNYFNIFLNKKYFKKYHAFQYQTHFNFFYGLFINLYVAYKKNYIFCKLFFLNFDGLVKKSYLKINKNTYMRENMNIERYISNFIIYSASYFRKTF